MLEGVSTSVHSRWPENYIDKPLGEYRMRVHPFSAVMPPLVQIILRNLHSKHMVSQPKGSYQITLLIVFTLTTRSVHSLRTVMDTRSRVDGTLSPPSYKVDI